MLLQAKMSSGVPPRFTRTSLHAITERNEVQEKFAEKVDKNDSNETKDNGNESNENKNQDASGYFSNPNSASKIVIGTSSNSTGRDKKANSVSETKQPESDIPLSMKVNTIAELKRLTWHNSMRMRNGNSNASLDHDTANSVSPSRIQARETTCAEEATPEQPQKSSDLLSRARSKWSNLASATASASAFAKRNTDTEPLHQERAFRRLVEMRTCDPEAVLHDLGFAADSEKNSLADRLPIRFLMQPSEAAGIDVLRFIRDNDDLAVFADELAGVNPYLRTLRTNITAPSSSTVPVSQVPVQPETQETEMGLRRTRRHGSVATIELNSGRNREEVMRMNKLNKLTRSSSLSADESDSRASILRRFTNSNSRPSLASALPPFDSDSTSATALLSALPQDDKLASNGTHSRLIEEREMD